MSRRSPSDTAQRAGLIAVAVALAAGLAAAAARLRRGSGRSDDQTYTCQCGAGYRVSGTDRHRVYWPAAAPEDAPVMGDRCVECDRPFPRGRVTRPV